MATNAQPRPPQGLPVIPEDISAPQTPTFTIGPPPSKEDLYATIPIATKYRLDRPDAAKVRVLQLSNTVAFLTGGTISQGTFGRVRIGLEMRSKRAVAIKEMNHNSDVPFNSQIFSDEVMRLDMLSFGLNFYGVYELEHKPRYGFMMSCMDGCLTEIAYSPSSTPRFRKDVARMTGRLIGAELKHFHASGFIHGDIKPGNILFNANGIICSGDLGSLAQLNERGVTRDKDVNCTIMSPEYYAGEPGSPALDIFSLGYTLWKLNVPENYSYGVGNTNNRESPSEHNQWIDWALKKKLPSNPTERIEKLQWCWQQFKSRDPVVANFVLNNMITKQVTAAEVVRFFHDLDISEPEYSLNSKLKNISAGLATHRERKRLLKALEEIRDAASDLSSETRLFADIFRPHLRVLPEATMPHPKINTYSRYQVAQVDLPSPTEVVKIVNDGSQYITSSRVAAYGESSTFRVMLTDAADSPLVIREFYAHPTEVQLGQYTPQILASHWEKHLDEINMRQLLGPNYIMHTSHRSASERGHVRYVQKLYACSLDNLAQQASPDQRRRLGYRLLADGARALHQLHEQGRAHTRLDLSHLLYFPGEPLALAGLSGTSRLGFRPTLASQLDATYLSPETLRGICYSRKTDLWGLGVCIWQMMVPDAELGPLRLRGEDLFQASCGVGSFLLWRAWTLDRSMKRAQNPPGHWPSELTNAWSRFRASDAPLADFVLQSMICSEFERCTVGLAITFSDYQTRHVNSRQTSQSDEVSLANLARELPVRQELSRLQVAKNEILRKYGDSTSLTAAIDRELRVSTRQ